MLIHFEIFKFEENKSRKDKNIHQLKKCKQKHFFLMFPNVSDWITHL